MRSMLYTSSFMAVFFAALALGGCLPQGLYDPPRQPTGKISIEERSRASQTYSGSTQVSSCGGATASASATVTTFAGIQKYQFEISSDSNAACGSNYPQDWLEFPTYDEGFTDAVVYSADQTGCGGNNWDIGASTVLNGNCAGGLCTFVINVTSCHSGVGNQCHSIQSSFFTLVFPPASSSSP